MIEPNLVRGILDLGVAGVVVIGFFLIINRTLRTKGEFEDAAKISAERIAELRADRDAWRAVAESFGAKVERLTDVLEAVVDKKAL